MALAPVLRQADPSPAWGPERLDPRIHCALYPASRSSPPLQAFRPDRLDEPLDAVTRTGLREADAERRSAHLDYDWTLNDRFGP